MEGEMMIMEMLLNVLATFVIACVWVLAVKERIMLDYISEHAGEPKAGLDLIRIVMHLLVLLLLAAIWF